MVGNILKVCLEEIDSRSSPAPVLLDGWWVVLSLMGQRTLKDLWGPLERPLLD